MNQKRPYAPKKHFLYWFPLIIALLALILGILATIITSNSTNKLIGELKRDETKRLDEYKDQLNTFRNNMDQLGLAIAESKNSETTKLYSSAIASLEGLQNRISADICFLKKNKN
jgi:uncharacterized membrane-anchored protein YhcB (DUF1043 family)